MKKLASSAFLIVVFGLYALSKRTVGSEVVVPPAPPTSESSASSQISSAEPPLPLPSSLSRSAPPVSVSSASLRVIPVPPPPVSSSSSASQGMYRNGTYTSPSVDAYYGNVQIRVAVRRGQIAGVQFLDHPQGRDNSVMINAYAMPILQSEAIQAQSAPVDIVSGATATSDAFNQTLASVLAQAKN